MTIPDGFVVHAPGVPGGVPENCGKVLSHFGVSWTLSTSDALLHALSSRHTSAPRARLICSGAALLRVLTALQQTKQVGLWRERVHSALVYLDGDIDEMSMLGASLGGVAVIDRSADSLRTDCLISASDDVCGALRGLHCPDVVSGKTFLALRLPADGRTESIITCNGATVLAKVVYQDAPVYVSAGRRVINLDRPLTAQNFDVRDEFLPAVPLVLYVKWAFQESCWTVPEPGACLIIDDPLLRRKYGFLDFVVLLDQMRGHGFTSSIAFIPWNWNRSRAAVSKLFVENARCYSLAVHGCDHTAAEFGDPDRAVLAGKVREATERMERHAAVTGVPYDRVMVFPQGVFSAAALGVLKHSHYDAAVNTTVVCCDPEPQPVAIRDAWSVALMRHAQFPLFSRRYPGDGLANFAFDALLGKPCLIVVHHDVFRDGGQTLLSLIDDLNRTKLGLRWRTLGEVVERSCLQRRGPLGAIEVKMYSPSLLIENRRRQATRYIGTMCAADPGEVRRITVNSLPVPWEWTDGQLRWETPLADDDCAAVRVHYTDVVEMRRWAPTGGKRVSIRVRRHLSEVRDALVQRLR